MKDDTIAIWLIVIALVFGHISGLIVGSVKEKDNMKLDAVATGHAEYYLDKDNNRQWRWKETK